VSHDLVLVGGGGHCQSCIDVIESTGQFRIVGIVDKPERMGESVCGYRVFATDEDMKSLVAEYGSFLITLGQIKTAERRRQIFGWLQSLGARLATVVSSTARVARTASLGEGSIIMHQVLVNSEARIGKNCIVNSKALVEHGAAIGDHCHVAPGAVINGEVSVGTGAFVGSGAVCLEGVRIGEGAVIGSHVVVLRDVPDGVVYKGHQRP
jgi:sugar O-acyltransferase (sialic acid O-acetyltransferase NeuD family)